MRKEINNNYLIFGIIIIISIIILCIIISQKEDSKNTNANTINTVKNAQTKIQIIEENTDKYGNITGVAKNVSNQTIRYIRISTNFYDKDGNKLEEVGDSIGSLEPNQTWKFSISSFKGPAKHDKLKINYQN